MQRVWHDLQTEQQQQKKEINYELRSHYVA